MEIMGFGIKLTQLREEHIELVRQHRNSPNIKQYMEYQDYISAEQQRLWFQSINNSSNNYFLIEHEGNKIGLIYGASIDWDMKETGNGGIFVWNESYYETPVTLAASMLLTEISFLLGLERTYIKVLRDNPRAISYNTNLGYTLISGQQEVFNQRYVLTEKRYYRKTARFRPYLIRHYGEGIIIIFDKPQDALQDRWITAMAAPNGTKNTRLKIIIEQA